MFFRLVTAGVKGEISSSFSIPRLRAEDLEGIHSSNIPETLSHFFAARFFLWLTRTHCNRPRAVKKFERKKKRFSLIQPISAILKVIIRSFVKANDSHTCLYSIHSTVPVQHGTLTRLGPWGLPLLPLEFSLSTLSPFLRENEKQMLHQKEEEREHGSHLVGMSA